MEKELLEKMWDMVMDTVPNSANNMFIGHAIKEHLEQIDSIIDTNNKEYSRHVLNSLCGGDHVVYREELWVRKPKQNNER